MTGLMESSKALFLRGHDSLLALDSTDYAVDSIGKVLIVDFRFAAAGGSEGRLIADVGDIGTGKTGGILGYEFKVEVRSQFERLEMDLEYFLALVEVGQGDMDLTVETACTHERLVEDVGAVGSCQHDNAGVGAETVHLSEQLVEGVLPFIIAGETDILAAGTTDCVYFVDKDYARGFLLGLGEKVADTGCTDTDEHLHEVGTAYTEERYVGLACDGLGQQGLTGTGGADKQSPLGDFAAESRVFFGVPEEVYDFHNFLLGAVKSGHVLESDLDFVFVC